MFTTWKECAMRWVNVENPLGNSLIGGIIGGSIRKQIGGGSEKEIATVLGAITEQRLEEPNLKTRETFRS